MTNSLNKKNNKFKTKQNSDPLTGSNCLLDNKLTNDMNYTILNKYDDTANFKMSHVNGVDTYNSNNTISWHILHNQPHVKK